PAVPPRERLAESCGSGAGASAGSPMTGYPLRTRRTASQEPSGFPRLGGGGDFTRRIGPIRGIAAWAVCGRRVRIPRRSQVRTSLLAHCVGGLASRRRLMIIVGAGGLAVVLP